MVQTFIIISIGTHNDMIWARVYLPMFWSDTEMLSCFQCAHLLGQCFSLIAEHASPDPSQQWVELVDHKSKAPSREDGEGGGEEQEVPAEQEPADGVAQLANKYSTVSLVVRQEEADAAEIGEAFALRFMTQAVHALTEAISLAVTNKQWVRMGMGQLWSSSMQTDDDIYFMQELSMQIALRLVDSVGLLDPPFSSLYLAFYQVGV
jgi:hypothetical protein